MYIHDIIDYQRGTFVAAVHTRSKGPCHFQVAHIAFVDLAQAAVAGICIIFTRMRPLIVVLHQVFKFSRGKAAQTAETQYAG